jgi:HAD superfamily hydrolase (TIGR01509 family)
MDGVLIDAKNWHYEALNHALRDCGYIPIEYTDHLENYDGLPTREKLQKLQKTQPIPDRDFNKINVLKQAYTHEMAADKCTKTPYHFDALAKLKSEGYRLALCSNSIRKSVDLMLSKAEITPFFDCILSHEDVGKAKPDPTIYNTAITNLGVSPKQTLVLEDNLNGVAAALKAHAFLYRIKTTTEVTYDNIKRKIHWLENEYKNRYKT